FDALSEGVALLDAEGAVVRCNQAFARLLAGSERDLVGRPLAALLEGEAGDTGETPFARMRRSHRQETVERHGHGRWLRVTGDPAERDPDVRRATDIVERQSRHLARLLDDLLDAARLAREKIELRRTATTLETAVAEALEATRELIDARGHAVDLALPSRPVWLD